MGILLISQLFKFIKVYTAMKSMGITKGILMVKSFIFYTVALVFLSSCGGGGSESSNELLDQADQTLDINQESISQTETFGGSSFGYTKFQ